MTVASMVRITWLLTFAVFVGIGIGVIWWPSSAMISSMRLQAAHYYEEANQNEADVRHASELQAIGERVQSDLRMLMPSSSSSEVTATLLQVLARKSRRYHLSIRSVAPDPASTSDGPFYRTSLELTLNGRFPDVLHFVAELPRGESLIEVHDMTLADPDRRDSSPTLTVTLHALLYRLRGGVSTGEIHVASSV